ncbi:GNAT family N-acetyltransferase [Liquorilactobacillus aquaticus]|nr:GNAT family N-acetyltransferase [Liquorilactobacillus aquaticus]
MIKTSKVELGDLTALSKLSMQSYKEAFYSLIDHKNVDSYADQVYQPSKLKTELAAVASDFYFLKTDDKICGYLKITKEHDFLEINRIYMLRGFKGLGIGSFAMKKAEEIARESKIHRLVLGVLALNKPAISFYSKKGFVEYSKTSVNIGDDPFTLLLMDKRI